MEKAIDQSKAWHVLRAALNNNYGFNADWDKAVELFEDRFLNHYMIPLDLIVDRKELNGEGFAIATIICSYIEALAAFKYGKIYNRKFRPRVDPPYEYASSSALYVRFLTAEDIFKDNFWCIDGNGAKQINQPYSAVDFYEDVRCALVHEARTKNDWHINARKSDKLTSAVFIEEYKGKKSLMRSILHARMLDYLTGYGILLRQNDQIGENARRLFARKMDHLFEIGRDEANFEWWRMGAGDQ